MEAEWMCTSLFTSVITGAQSERVKDNQTEEGKGIRRQKRPPTKTHDEEGDVRRWRTRPHHVRGGTAKQAGIPSIAELWLAMWAHQNNTEPYSFAGYLFC